MNNNKTDSDIHLSVSQHTSQEAPHLRGAGGVTGHAVRRCGPQPTVASPTPTTPCSSASSKPPGDGCGPSNSAAGLAALGAAVRDYGLNAVRLTAGQVAPASARQSLLRHCETPRSVLDKRLVSRTGPGRLTSGNPLPPYPAKTSARSGESKRDLRPPVPGEALCRRRHRRNRRRAARSTLELIRKPPRMRSAVLVEVGKQAGTSGGRSSVVISGQAVPAGPSTITTDGRGSG